MNEHSPIQELLNTVFAKYKTLSDGHVADYIPELGLADPNWYGIAIATVDGHLYTAGDVDQTFTIQSISKAFTYAMALQERGLSHVLSKVGVEPSGDAFNAISLDEKGRPANPMINAGAIATTGLIIDENNEGIFEKILRTFGEFAGDTLSLDEKVYRSESDTGHRNRAIGFMLRNFDIIEDDPLPVLENYFKQCSILVNCKDLALMGATLANHGIYPKTGRQVVESVYIKNVLSAMGSCGMYDYSGNWLYQVGLPAKSGVGGGILTVLPGQMSIAVFSPPLDEKGNSCRGIATVRDLSQQLNLHVFNTGITTASVIRSTLDLSSVRSNRQRTPESKECLNTYSQSAMLYQIQGYFDFVACEKVIRHVLSSIKDQTKYVMLNLSRVLGISHYELDFLQQLAQRLKRKNIQIIFCDESNDEGLKSYFTQPNLIACELFSQQNDMLEYVENQVLNAHLDRSGYDSYHPLESFSVCENMGEHNIEMLKSLLTKIIYKKGVKILSYGKPAKALYFLVEGHVDVYAPIDNLKTKVASISSGNLFGEMAIIDGHPRYADVVAATDYVTCLKLSVDQYDTLSDAEPSLKLALLRNIAADLANKLRSTSTMLHTQMG